MSAIRTWVMVAAVTMTAAGCESTLVAPDAGAPGDAGAADAPGDAASPFMDAAPPDAPVPRRDRGLPPDGRPGRDTCRPRLDAGPPVLVSLPKKTISFVAVGPGGQELFSLDTATGRAMKSKRFHLGAVFDQKMALFPKPGFTAHLEGAAALRTAAGGWIISLPGERGALRFVDEPGIGRSTLQLQRPDGTLVELFAVRRTPGAAWPQAPRFLVVSRDGRLAAGQLYHGPGAKPALEVVLLRTDAPSFPGKRYARRVTLTGAPAGARLQVLGFTAKNLWVLVGWLTAGITGSALYRVPVDAAARPARVTLPKVGGKAPAWIDGRAAFAAGGSRLVLTAGRPPPSSSYDSTYEDVITVDDAGNATNVSHNPGNYAASTRTVGGWEALQVSPGGKWVAYTRVGPERYVKTHALYATASHGLGKAHLVYGSALVHSAYTWGARFAGDDQLLVSARSWWSGLTTGGLLRYDLKAYRLYGIPGAGVVPGGKPTAGRRVWPRGTFWSPSRRYLYAVEMTNTRPPGFLTSYNRRLHVIDAKTWRARELAPGMYVSGRFAGVACRRKGLVLFAMSRSTDGHFGVWVFDANRAGKPVKLLPAGKPPQKARLEAAAFSPDCTHALVFYRHDPDHGNVYLVRLGPPVVVTILTRTSGCHPDLRAAAPDLVFSADGKLAAFAAGRGYRPDRLYAVDVASARAVPIYPTGPGLRPHDWQILGIR